MPEGSSSPESTPQPINTGSQENSAASAPEVNTVDPKEKQRLYIRSYLTSGANRIGNVAQEIGPWAVNDANRQIFIEEWTRAVASAKNLEQLASVNNLAWDPHQFGGLSSFMKSRIEAAKPELKGKYFLQVANFPEYDGIRRAVGEKLKAWGLTNSGINDERFLGRNGNSPLRDIFYLLHPNPYEEYTYVTTKTETRGKFFKKQVKVPVEKRDKRLRPYEQLMTELLQYQPQSTPAVSPKA